MIEEIDKEKSIKIITDLLPKNSEILVLALTGSRAFGWGGEVYDIDIRGVFSCKDWWETIHWGRCLYDINLEELYHAFNSVTYKYWTFFEDLSKPFYIHSDFDYKTMFEFCTSANIKQHMMTIKRQLRYLELHEIPRTALHCYRVLMVPLHFLRTGEIEIDVIKLNEDFQYEELFTLADTYLRRVEWHGNWYKVKKHLKELSKTLKDELKERDDVLDMEKYKEWRKKMSTRFYGEKV